MEARYGKGVTVLSATPPLGCSDGIITTNKSRLMEEVESSQKGVCRITSFAKYLRADPLTLQEGLCLVGGFRFLATSQGK